MDDVKRTADDGPDTDLGMGRRAFFSRTLLAAGAAVTLFGLTGCPGGDGDDDDGDDDGDDD
jgi:hypothetical protein